MADISEVGVPTVTLTLPASKVDQEARGTTRSHACWCPPGGPRTDCPVHAIADQLVVLRTLFPARFHDGAPDVDLPLLPSAAGAAVTKQAMTSTILEAAARLGVPAQSADGASRVSGHSLRPTGAQGLTRLGLDVWAVQLIGRWGSSAVQAYVRDAAVSTDAAVARSRLLSRTLGDYVLGSADASAAGFPEAFAHLRAELLQELSAEVGG